MKSDQFLFAAALLLIPISSADAQVLVDHQSRALPGRLDLTPVLSFTEIEYETDGGSGEIERTILGLSGGYGVAPDWDLYGELGYIAEAEFENVNDDGDGFLLGGGARGVFFRQDKFSLRGFGGIRGIWEDYGDSADGEIVEVQLGLLGRLQATPQFGAYLGLDAVPFSDGEVDTRAGDIDIDRDDLLGLRLGADYLLQSVTLNAEAALISEEGFILRATFPLS